MKSKVLAYLLLTLVFTACQKQPEQSPLSEPDKMDTTAKVQFETSDKIINEYLDQLDSSTTPIEEKTKILCKDYPSEYKTNYIPNLLKIAPQNYTEAKLLADLDLALNYYKEKLNISCENN